MLLWLFTWFVYIFRDGEALAVFMADRLLSPLADIAHLVERHLAKVEVASSSLVARSRVKQDIRIGCPVFCVRRKELATSTHARSAF